MKRTLAAVSAALVLLAFAGCKKQVSPDVAATVNSKPITYAEVDKLVQAQFGPDTAKKATDDAVAALKLQVLVTMINGEIMLQRAEKQNLMASDSEVDQRVNEIKAPYTQEEFQKWLRERNMSLDDLRRQFKHELSVQKLVNRDITSKIAIADKEITDFYTANKQSFNLPEPQIHLAQIVVTPMPDPNVRNLRGNKAQNPEEARKKMETIVARLRQGEDFAVVAQNLSEDPEHAPNGGDLGFIPESALDKSPELKKMVQSMQLNQTSPVMVQPDGFRILKLISREPAGQRELNDPRVQQAIRETLINRKDQLLRDAYTESARNEAEVVNYFARGVVEKFGTKP